MAYLLRTPIQHLKSEDHRFWGVFFGIASAFAYTTSNVCLRELSTRCDPIWVSLMKAFPIFLLSGIAVISRAKRGKQTFRSFGWMLPVIAISIFMQLGGNVTFQWSLGQIGLAITIPLTFGVILLSGALLGPLYLEEELHSRSIFAMTVLIGAILILSIAAHQNPPGPSSNLPDLPPFYLAMAILAASIAGFAYGSSNALLRHYVKQGYCLSTILCLMSGTGLLCLGTITLTQNGLAILMTTNFTDYLIMLVAGVFNAIAFFTLAKSLQLLPILQANLVGVSQVAMGSLAGVLLFCETLSWLLVTGILLTAVGVVMIKGIPHGQQADGLS